MQRLKQNKVLTICSPTAPNLILCVLRSNLSKKNCHKAVSKDADFMISSTSEATSIQTQKGRTGNEEHDVAKTAPR